VHGDADSHIDALCHAMYRRTLYNQVASSVVTGHGAAQQVTLGPGDLLFVRAGHRRRRGELGPWDAAAARAGLQPEALEFVAGHEIAVLGSDSNSNVSPSAAEGVSHPVHVLAINALGLHLLDYLQFEELVPLCEKSGHWSVFCVIAPLRLPSAPGSPVNPIAIV
jgi:kynurenine formamidase